jgi:hypothetical protein
MILGMLLDKYVFVMLLHMQNEVVFANNFQQLVKWLRASSSALKFVFVGG